MERLTDREKIICALENCIGQPKCADCPWEACEVEHEVVNRVPYGLLRDALAMLKEQDNCENCSIAVEDRQLVVRCKDCKHWSAERIYDYNKCKRWINVGVKNFATKGEWFCADGERRDDDG